MGRRVAVVAAGSTAYGDSPVGLREMVREAVDECAKSADQGVDLRRVGEGFVGSLGFGGGQLGNLAAVLNETAGLRLVSARRVENACASGGFAFRDAVAAVSSASCELALAVGVERMNDQTGLRKRYWLGVSGETEWERMAGLTFPGVYATMASRHMHEFGTTSEDLASVAVKNHGYGALNPKAQFRRAVTLEDALKAPVVASPLTLYDCCATTDGAAAVLVASEEAARDVTDTPVWVAASAGASDFLAAHDRESLTRLDATRKAAKDAYARAGVGPGDIDVAEVHDCFTIAEIMALEDLGFCAKGAGGAFTREGQSKVGGKVAVNTSGGLKAKGHPLGATGVGQIYELVRQLRGHAEPGRQVGGAETALAHNVGGSGATCAVHILTR
ncbi:MAG TPA: thiolase domain-containing protein [Candidatus Thermoplasmatota archaeon]|nr:thiolase domain-containing protein [Candidatus Thermoplasmatota archaeon]